jgi:dihydrofolate reductase
MCVNFGFNFENMRKVKLYIAMSLDGMIARNDGDVSWLNDIANEEGTDHGYSDFYKSVDAIVMGHNTYKIIEGFGIDFPYPDKDCYVVTTQNDIEGNDDVSFVSGDIKSFLKHLTRKKGGDIWLVGGGLLNSSFLNEGLIDELIVFVMPIVVGEGIHIFEGDVNQTLLTLIETKTWSTGAVQHRYNIKK